MNAALSRLNAEAEARFRGGLEWWLSELQAMLPWRLGTDPERAAAILEFAGDTATLVLARRGAHPALRIPLERAEADLTRPGIQAALRERRLGNDVAVRLDPSVLLETELSLPFGAERAMRQILLNQLDRVVPLPADEVEFQYRIAPRSASARALRVRLTVVARETIAQAQALARALGLAPSLMFASPPSGSATGFGRGRPLILWRAGRDSGDAPRLRRTARILELAAIVLVVTAFGTYVYRLDQQLADLEEDVAVKARLASAARDLGRQQQDVEATLDMLHKREREPRPLQILEEATELVPDDSWVTRLTVRGRTVELLGNSPRVSDLVARLDNHDTFWDPQFLSPITQAPDGATQRFNLSFQIWLEGDDP